MSSQELPNSQQRPEELSSQQNEAREAPFSSQHHEMKELPASSDPAPTSSPAVLKQEDAAAPAPPPTDNPRLTSLNAKRAALEEKLATLASERASLVADSKLPSGLDMPASWSDEEKEKHAMQTANATIKEHIALLHKYNEIKDIGLGLMGLVAESRGVRQGVVMEEYGMTKED